MIKFELCNDWDWAREYVGCGFGDPEGKFEFYAYPIGGDWCPVLLSFSEDGFSEYPLDVVVV